MSEATPIAKTDRLTWRSLFPGISELIASGKVNFRHDLIAAVTLAAYLLPSNIADASLAGLPPQAGLYACLFGGLVFWLFCSGKHTAITATSAISLLIGSTLGDLSGGDGHRAAALAACVAMMVGTFALIAWLIRAGSLVNFISETVMLGFKAGVALHLASTQLPKLFGIDSGHGGDFWHRMGSFFSHIKDTHALSLGFGLAALAILIAGKFLLKNKPVALFVMIAGIAITHFMHLGGDGGMKVLGAIPKGIPVPGLPAVTWSDINDLVPLALACFLLGAVETAAIGRMFSAKHGYRLDSNQDFLALAGANLAAGMGHGFAVSGGMSQSLVNENAGARSSLAGFLAAIIVLLVTVFLSGLLHDLPKTVLAAIVLSAVMGLIKVKALKRLWHFNKGEFLVAMAALAGVLFRGLLQGVLIGAVLSILVLLRRASRPHTTELGQVPGSTYFADLFRHAENKRVPGVFVFRSGGAILYFNAEHIRDRFVELLNQREDKITLAVFFLGNTAMVDLAGAEMLAELAGIMKGRGVDFALAEAHGGVRDALRRAGYDEHVGPVEANLMIHEIISRKAAREAANP